MLETLTLSIEDGQKVHDALAETVEKHIDAHYILAPLNYDPVSYPFQSFDTAQVAAEPGTPTELQDVATIANGRLFNAVQEGLQTKEAAKTMQNLRRAGKNLIVVTTHQSVTDMPVIAAGATLNEYDPNKNEWSELVENNGVVVGRAMTTLQALGEPVIKIVNKGGEIFLSTPRTRTIDALVRSMPELLLPTIINNSNGAMRAACKQWLAEPAPPSVNVKKLYVAWGGRTDIVKGDPARPDSISMGKAHPAVCDITQSGIVVPTVSWDRGPEHDQIFVLGEPTVVATKEDVERVEEWQRSTLAAHLGVSQDAVSLET